MLSQDTIVALATPPGKGGVAIVRLSGPKAYSIALKLLPQSNSKNLNLIPRKALFSKFIDINQNILDEGLCIYFKAPYSYTGEDIVEFQCHGSPIVVDLLCENTIKLGARLARPGEFSERAFLNDKMDLAQAEAVADLIDAQSKAAVQSALNSLSGLFSDQINHLVSELISLRVYVEAAIDFPEEEIDFLSDGHVSNRLEYLKKLFQNLFKQSKQGQILKEGIQLVIAGKPNAGKSSLLNALSGEETAIVTDIPGTTRDVLSSEIILSGVPIHILDTAGIRETNDIVEQEGVKRAKSALLKADMIILLIDAQDCLNRDFNIDFNLDKIKSNILKNIQLNPDIPIVFVLNKIDLISPDNLNYLNYFKKLNKNPNKNNLLFVSAKKRENLDQLEKNILQTVGYNQTVEGVFSARRRHIDALNKAYESVLNGEAILNAQKAGELLAEDLKSAQNDLNQITGEFRSDDLLGEIFSSFCIGK